MKTHLINYPPRGTACGLYYPKMLYENNFGTYYTSEVTCINCKQVIKRKLKDTNKGGK